MKAGYTITAKLMPETEYSVVGGQIFYHVRDPEGKSVFCGQYDPYDKWVRRAFDRLGVTGEDMEAARLQARREGNLGAVRY